jgi:hypothetical protein
MRQTSTRMTSIPAKIRCEYLQDASQKRYISASRLSLEAVLDTV